MISIHPPRFSLIELLVIIVGASVLATLLFPVLAQKRQQAASGICLTNMKQVLVAARMYSIDYDGELPVVPGNEKNPGAKAVDMKPVLIYH
jgi:competence protein ComGC